MSIIADYEYKLDGGYINFPKYVQDEAVLALNQTLTVSADAVGGQLMCEVESLNARDPGPHTRVVHGVPQEETYNYVRVNVELLSADSNPVLTWTTPQGSYPDLATTTDPRLPKIDRTYNTGAFAWPPNTWNLRVTNRSSTQAHCRAGMQCVYSRVPLNGTDIPVRVLDRAMSVALEALTPFAALHGTELVVSFGEEVRQFGQSIPGIPLGEPIVIQIPQPFSAEGQLLSLKLTIESGQDLLTAMNSRYSDVKAALTDRLSHATTDAEKSIINQLLSDNGKWQQHYAQNVQPNFVTLHAQAVASDITISAQIAWGEIIEEAKSVSINIYVAFEPSFMIGHTLVLSPAKFEGTVAELALELGIIQDAGPLIEKNLTPAIDNLTPLLGRYFAEVLLRAARGPGVFYTATANTDGKRVHVAHCDPPGTPEPWRPAIFYIPPDPGPPGTIPPDFIIPNPETLARLDKIDTIIVLMMENRSFDHMLGYLRQSRGVLYDGLTLHETNPPPPDRTGLIGVQRASDVLNPATGHPITEIMVCPDHSFGPVKMQINDGRMDGFVRSLASRTSQVELAMCYYTDAELDAYYTLAANFCVAQRWFAAHPGPTWPNRWCTVQGHDIPAVDNLDFRDPQIGFIRKNTIFNQLTAEGIEFRFFEHNVSIMRSYDQYRIDDTYVVPFDDPKDGFEALADRGALPPVVFIDPRFVDIPPVEMAWDDLAPADLALGQKNIKKIFNAVITHPQQWMKTLFVITYDEHGGFFDHVPPPGTSAGEPQYIGQIPKIHADGAPYLGVRLPAFIITPWVGAGSVCNTVFDHTSIIKTILVRHRAKLHEGTFWAFGPRVMRANYLGAAFDQPTARTDLPSAFPMPVTRRRDPQHRKLWDNSKRARPTYPKNGDRHDFNAALARAMVPRMS